LKTTNILRETIVLRTSLQLGVSHLKEDHTDSIRKQVLENNIGPTGNRRLVKVHNEKLESLCTSAKLGRLKQRE
jgi:hypothetical protein